MVDEPRVSLNMMERYIRAERLLPWNASQLMSDLTVEPHWIDESDRFWYRFKRLAGVEIMLVDPEAGTREPAFDHKRLAASLSSASGIPCTDHQLPFETFEFTDTIHITFEVNTSEDDNPPARWSCDLITYTCTRLEDAPKKPNDVVCSPDEQWEAFVCDYNVWLRSVDTGEERAITTDGDAKHGYGEALPSPLASAGIADPVPPVIIWSPDSKHVLFCRIDQRQARQFHLVQSVPLDGSIRPQLHTYAYPLPGDTDVPMAQLLVAGAADGEVVIADMEPLHMLYYGSPINPEWTWWAEDSRTIYIIRRERGYKSYALIAIDASTGTARVVVEDRGKRALDPSFTWGEKCVRVINDGSRVIWYSQRDGWGHLYLYDAATGELLHQITSGPFAVIEILHVDEAQGLIYFTALGREADRDPYYAHVYSVSLDGGEPELITAEDADHTVVFSPGGCYFVDTFSTVATPPVSVVCAVDEDRQLILEKTEIDSLLATGWQAPERFCAKGRDGMTDVYGMIFRPSYLDTTGHYPIIDSIYAGAQVNQAPAAFADSARGRGGNFWQAQALAELGFIVVMIDGLGMPGRSKAYHDVSYHNLGDAGLEDHISALRQLADQYRYFDLSRVGIFGHSAGGYASTRAIFTYPDFYKVCVSSAGNHDHRLDKASWVERYMGFPVEDHYREQANQTNAHNLCSKLLLIHGEMDENVHVSSTLVVVDALIKANKDFDLLIMPNRPHSCTNDPYFVRRRWDYFVRHLLGTEPPAGYHIQPDSC